MTLGLNSVKLETLLYVLGTLFVVIAAWLQYKSAVAGSRSLIPSSGLRLVRMGGKKEVDHRPWTILKVSYLALGLFYLFIGLGWLFLAWRADVAVIAYCPGGLLALFSVPFFNSAKVLWREPWAKESKVARKSEIEVEGEYDVVFERCQRALLTMKAAITEFDRDAGFVEARLKGDKIQVQVARTLEPNRIKIIMKSDSTLPTVTRDFGRNDSNVKRLSALILG